MNIDKIFEHKGILLVTTVFLFLVCCGFFLVKDHATRCGIETSRLAVIDSVVSDGTFAIDNSVFETPDKAEINGHFYGDKPPFLTLLGIVWYRIVSCFTGGFRNNLLISIYFLNLFFYILTMTLPLFFYKTLRRYSPRSSAFYCGIFAILAVFSTLVFSYSVTLNNHTVCALCLILLLAQLNRPLSDINFKQALLSGVLIGIIFNLDFVIGGVFGITGFFYLSGLQNFFSAKLFHSKKLDSVFNFERSAGYSIGAIAMLLVEAGLNYQAYGSCLPLYLISHNPDFISKNYFSYFFNILFGFEGFFLYMPALLWIGFTCTSKRFREDGVFHLIMLSFLLTVLLLVIGTSDYGGWCYGYRFLIPFAPVFLFYIAAYFRKARPRLTRFRLFRLFLAWGVLTALFGTCNPWTAGYEGSSTPSGALPNLCKNSFLLNTFVFSWQYAPNSFMTDFFVSDVYGPEYSALCLLMELNNRNDEESIVRLYREMEQKKAE